jgi:hypothetical protein
MAEFKGSEGQSDRHVGLVVDQVELEQFFIQKHFRFPLPVTIPPTLYTHLS